MVKSRINILAKICKKKKCSSCCKGNGCSKSTSYLYAHKLDAPPGKSHTNKVHLKVVKGKPIKCRWFSCYTYHDSEEIFVYGKVIKKGKKILVHKHCSADKKNEL